MRNAHFPRFGCLDRFHLPNVMNPWSGGITKHASTASASVLSHLRMKERAKEQQKRGTRRASFGQWLGWSAFSTSCWDKCSFILGDKNNLTSTKKDIVLYDNTMLNWTVIGLSNSIDECFRCCPFFYDKGGRSCWHMHVFGDQKRRSSTKEGFWPEYSPLVISHGQTTTDERKELRVPFKVLFKEFLIFITILLVYCFIAFQFLWMSNFWTFLLSHTVSLEAFLWTTPVTTPH